jgi:hypothetical protein
VSDALGRARQQRVSLRGAIGDVESALAAPAPGREPTWRGQLHGQLEILHHALDRHIAATEADDGLLAEIIESAPRLARKVEQARAEHQTLRSNLEHVTAAVRADADVGSLRDDVLELLTRLVRHRQLGADLVYDAYNVDIEAAD